MNATRQYTLRLCVLPLLIGAWLSFGQTQNSTDAGATPTSGGQTATSRSAFIERIREPYTHAIEANRADSQINQKKADFYRSKALEFVGASDGASRKKEKEVQELAKAYQTMSEHNAAVVSSFDEGKIKEAYDAMAGVLALEKKIQTITGKEMGRDWITLQEMRQYEKQGYKCKVTRKSRVLPLLKAHWEIRPATPKPKAAAADNKANPEPSETTQ